MGQKIMFEENFLGCNFNLGQEKKFTPFFMVTTRREVKKPQQTKPKRTPVTKQDQNTPQKPLIGIKAKWYFMVLPHLS